jgi:predicted NAD-dependent protein-ADP-ribosyltransferase YbiA (DUF1768 family)
MIDHSLVVYPQSGIAAFRKISDEFGLLSNMAEGFDIANMAIQIRSTEALYQACKFPHDPAYQVEVLMQPTPVMAKRHAYLRHDDTRSDWQNVNVPIMHASVLLKTISNRKVMTSVLAKSAGQNIVEVSVRDDFYGAKPVGSNYMGRNVLGKIWEAVRPLALSTDPEDALLDALEAFPADLIVVNNVTLGEIIDTLHVKRQTSFAF